MYKKFIKPTQANLLELLKLDREYVDGHGNYIYDTNGVKTLDMTGSYGANNLGHGNEIRKKASEYLMEHSLSFTQGSIKSEAAKLASLVNESLNKEGHEGTWISQFSNSGTESVEIAIKISRRSYFNNQLKKSLEVNESFNKAIRFFQKLNNLEVLEKLSIMKKNNETILSQTPKIVALENAFHGKSSGSLKLTYNSKLKEDLLSNKDKEETIYIKSNDKFDLMLKLETAKQYLELPSITNGELHIESEAFYPICGLILEPIQGEAGVKELEQDFLEECRTQTKRINALLIFDEVQTGVYRTGTFSCATHLGVTPDIMTFAKGLSAGFAKTGLTVVSDKAFPEDFDFIQTSTFAEDDLSSFVAKEVILESCKQFKNNQTNINLLKLKLSELANSYPQVFSEVRGRGVMMAIEINSAVKNMFYEFKYFADGALIGHLFSSALLNNENLRIAPTLSNQLTLRVQPSITVQSWEILKLINGLENMAKAILSKDAKFFFQHILGEIKVGSLGEIDEKVAKQIEKDYKESAVFLNHPIENDDVRKILPVLEFTPDEVLEEIMLSTFNLQSFSPYYSENVDGENGKNIDIVMLSIPVTSKILFKKFRSRDRHIVAKKIQEGIDKAKELGASTVGLGQFTSIVSKNGMYLDNKELNLTTGNSFTAKLAYEAGLEQSYQEKKVVGLVGYGGNIVSTIAQLSLHDADKVCLFHRSKDIYPQKIRANFEELIKYVITTKIESPLISKLRTRAMDNLGNIAESLDKFSDLIEISNDLSKLKECNLIFTGTNSTKAIISEEMVTAKTTIIDLAVPGDVTKECYESDSIRVIKGGIAKFPIADRDIQIQIPSFPLERNESFACMAETFSLGLSQKKGHLNIGPIAIEDIMDISEVAKDAGFTLYKTKKTNSL